MSLPSDSNREGGEGKISLPPISSSGKKPRRPSLQASLLLNHRSLSESSLDSNDTNPAVEETRESPTKQSPLKESPMKESLMPIKKSPSGVRLPSLSLRPNNTLEKSPSMSMGGISSRSTSPASPICSMASQDSFTVPTNRILEMEKSKKFRRPSSPADVASPTSRTLLKMCLSPKVSQNFFADNDEETVATLHPIIAAEVDEYSVCSLEESAGCPPKLRLSAKEPSVSSVLTVSPRDVLHSSRSNNNARLEPIAL